MIGAALAWLASIQIVTIAALSPLVAAGPVLAALAGAGAGGALGWAVGLLAGMRLSEYVARRYAGRIRRGGLLLSVHCDSQEWCNRAKKSLRDTGARQISSVSEARRRLRDHRQADGEVACGHRRPGRSARPTGRRQRRSRKQETGGYVVIAYIGHIDKQALENTDFRRVLFTGKYTQLVMMCLGPGEEIGEEVHEDIDQFFRMEQGEASFVFNGGREHPAREGDVVVVPAGTSIT